MKTTKTTTTAYEVNGSLVLGVNTNGEEIDHHTTFFVKLTDRYGSHMTEYTASEMEEVFGLTEVQMLNMIQQLV